MRDFHKATPVINHHKALLFGYNDAPSLDGNFGRKNPNWCIGPIIRHSYHLTLSRLSELANKGVKIDGAFLTNLRFVDDIIFLHTETTQELQQMLQVLSIAKRNVMIVL